MGMARMAILKHVDATVGATLCRLLGALNYRARRGIPYTDDTVGPVRRILVVRPGGLGDMLLLLPVLRALQARYPDARLDLVCERRNLDVVQLAGLNVGCLPYDTQPFALLRGLLRGHYDLAVDTEQFHNFSAVFALLSGARVRIGFNINPRRNALYTHLIDYAPAAREDEQFAQLLAPLGGDPGPAPFAGCLAGANLPLPPAAAGAWPSSGEGRRGVAVLHAGCSTPYKLWPPERFAALGQRLRDNPGVDLVLVGGRDDLVMRNALLANLRGAGGGVVDLVGRLTLMETAAVIQRARLFVGPDSGLAHLAAALGTPSVVLFGPSEPRKWGLIAARHAVVRHKLPCAPCFIFGYSKPCRTIACMERITVDAVHAACRDVFAAAGP